MKKRKSTDNTDGSVNKIAVPTINNKSYYAVIIITLGLLIASIVLFS